MKKLLLLVAIVPFFAFQCARNSGNKCLAGKVIRITCASYVIQVLNDDSIGDDQWKNSMQGEQDTFDNVFNASNKCNIPSSYKAGDTLYFKIDKPQPSDCVVCMMYDAPPKAQFDVKNVSSSPCE